MAPGWSKEWVNLGSLLDIECIYICHCGNNMVGVWDTCWGALTQHTRQPSFSRLLLIWNTRFYISYFFYSYQFNSRCRSALVYYIGHLEQEFMSKEIHSVISYHVTQGSGWTWYFFSFLKEVWHLPTSTSNEFPGDNAPIMLYCWQFLLPGHGISIKASLLINRRTAWYPLSRSQLYWNSFTFDWIMKSIITFSFVMLV